jgi:hypothetical protein
VTRRSFILTTATVTAADAQTSAASPWYRRCVRWGQTNITERDPDRYDIPWWRAYWKRTQVQGVIINAGGIVAYYPSKYPLHHRAEFLNGRDLYGDLARAAHEDGLAVLARMDSNRTAEDFYKAHSTWFSRNASGDPIRAADKYVTCINSPYYDEYIPGILTEIIERSHPEGLTDNSWAGLGRDTICYCDNCARSFRDKTAQALPRSANWDDPIYRQWIDWSYARRVAVWELNNRVAKAAGGPNCLWIGMNSGSITSQASSFRDFAEICKRAEFMLLDHQSRSDATGFQQNGDTGKLVHGILGWDKVMPESMAMYQAGRSSFRVAAKPAAEARMWMIEGIAGGIQPWWHHVGAFLEDRRAFDTAEPIMRWHKANEQYLMNRQPIAAVGVVWSQRNTDFYGRNDAADLVDAPYRGFTQALIRARIPYIPIFADYIDRDGANLSTLVLPAVGALSDQQCAAIRRFVERGGGLIATGPTSLYTERGDARPDFALADLFGAHASAMRRPSANSAHTYLRIAQRHDVLRGFDQTDILAFGGQLEPLRLDPGVTVPLTFIPAFPVYPPETAWMRTPNTDIPGLVFKGRVAYLPADLDRRYARENLPDHADLLANLVRWSSAGRIPLGVRGAGLVDCQLYHQPGRVILHLVNLISAGTWRGPIDELIPIGPLQVKVKLPADVKGRTAQLLVAGRTTPASTAQGWATLDVKSILDHEVVVIG